MRTYPTELDSLHRIREFVRSGAQAAHLDDDLAGDAVLAASEASANAVLHSGGTFVRVEFEVGSSSLRIRVEDDGLYERRAAARYPDGDGGRGLQIILALMDEVTLEQGSPEHPGTRVTMTKSVA